MTSGRLHHRSAERAARAGAACALGALALVCSALAAADERGWALSVDGEVRERFESSDHPVFGLSAPAHDDYLLHRVYLGVDLQAPRQFRLHVEGVSATTSGSEETSPTQDDPADVLQAFAEVELRAGSGKLLLRAGRQELKLGASRLVSVRESPNVHRAFDGLRASWAAGHTHIDAFFVHPVIPESGTFDDGSSAAQEFWGLYATTPLPGHSGLSADVYYLGLNRQTALFSAGRAGERRHTIGARMFGDHEHVDLNLEGAWQWGTFGDLNIRAWTLSADVGYSVRTWSGSPRLGLKADVISGDRDAGDHTLGTFNPLFPRLPYFSEANIATPANLIDLQPSIRWTLPRKITATLSWDALWKYARQDAFYAPPLAPEQGTAGSSSSYIGEQVSALAQWQATERLSLSATYVYFEPGALVRDAGGQSGSFGAAWAQLRF